MAIDDGTERRIETKSRENNDTYPCASSFPWLIPLVVAANVVVFIVVMFINNCPRHLDSRYEEECLVASLGRFSFEPLDENHLYGPSFAVLKKLGAMEWERIVTSHEVWRLVTFIWLHAGIFHLVPTIDELGLGWHSSRATFRVCSCRCCIYVVWVCWEHTFGSVC